MLYLINHHGLKPRYYCPQDPVSPSSILPHPACGLYSIEKANMFCGKRSIRAMHSTTEYIDVVGLVKESMPQGTLQDLI